MIEFVDSNSVISEQQYNHLFEYKGKHLFLKLKLACHNAITGSSLNFVCFGIFYQAQFVVIVLKPTEML